MQKIFLAFLLLLLFLPSIPPSSCLLEKRGVRPQCKQTHRAATTLIVFPKHIFRPYAHCRELSIYPFFFPYIASSETFMTVSKVQQNSKLLLDLRCKGETMSWVQQHLLTIPVQSHPCSQVVICCMGNMKGKYCESIACSFFLSFQLSLLHDAQSDQSPLIVFHLW